MSKSVRYEGKIYSSEGELVNALIENELYFVEVWITPDRKYEKMILSFRVISPDNKSFINTTFYRAKKYLNESTLDNIELFKEIKHNRDQKNFRNFGQFLDQHRFDEKRYKTDVEFMEMVDCITEMRGTQL